MFLLNTKCRCILDMTFMDITSGREEAPNRWGEEYNSGGGQLGLKQQKS